MESQSLRQVCCDLKPHEVLAYPDMDCMISELFQPIYAFNFGSKAATWYICKSCEQKWLYSKVCMGHRDWDQHLQKCNSPDAFFKLAEAAIPK